MSVSLATKGVIGEGAAVTWSVKEHILSDFFLEVEFDEPSLEVESAQVLAVEAEIAEGPELTIDVEEPMVVEVDTSDLVLVVEVENG